METDDTHLGMSGPHPTIAQLRNPTGSGVAEHIASCSMCRSVIAADVEDVPIPLDLPKGLVTESAFRWPADPLARGGMAQIFAGEDKRLGRTVILKAPREDDNLPPYMIEMFHRRVKAEARVLAKLQHPAIVTLFELGKATPGWPFCVLEKVDGISLREKLDQLAELEMRDGRPRTSERLELLAELVSIAEALAYAHEHRVVHRDCTPNNILLGKRGEATLIDWGIARDLDAPGGVEPVIHDESPSVSGRMVTISAGTPPYLPLEQSQGRKADPSFDVYSFGVTLYECVSGRTPFEWRPATSMGGRTAQLDAFVAWLQSDEVVPPAMPKDPELSGIIARAMHKDPAQRFTADELVRALKQYLTGDLVFSHRYSLTGRLARWARHHRGATMAILVLLASIVAGALVWVQVSRIAAEDAELRAVAAASRAEASDKERAAEAAMRAADEANAKAEEAQREGKNADELRREAERKKKAADVARHDAEHAAQQARGTADEAVKRFEQAMKDKEDAERARDASQAAQAQAEHERDAARVAQDAADKQRDAAVRARDAAEQERDAAKASATAAENDRAVATTARDAAEKAREAAVKERDAAIEARSSVEKERDELKKKVEELEARKAPPAPAPAPAPPEGPTTTPAP
ncbi:MAG: protein kinase domain-containing protein [Acidobacteriota bacterium]